MLGSIEIFERMAVLSVTRLCLSFKPPFYKDLVTLGQRPIGTWPAGSLRGPADGGATREPERDHGGTFHFTPTSCSTSFLPASPHSCRTESQLQPGFMSSSTLADPPLSCLHVPQASTHASWCGPFSDP